MGQVRIIWRSNLCFRMKEYIHIKMSIIPKLTYKFSMLKVS